MKKPLALLGVSALLGLGALALSSGPAQAAGATDCRTTVATVKNRADRGFGTENDRVWAYKDFTRTTKICRVVPAVEALSNLNRWNYQATVTDTGTFITVEGSNLSPEKAGPLVGGVKGTVTGGFTAQFSASANFHGYNAAHDGKVYTGEKPTNQEWVRVLFDEEANFEGDSFGNRWGWTYTTGCETWKDVHAGGDEKDITGLTCPTPSPSPSESQSPSPTPSTTSPSATATTGAPRPTTTTTPQAGLPVTGDKGPGKFVVIGVAALVLGGAGFIVARKRRDTKFIAE